MALSEYKMFINGLWVDAQNGARFDSLNPANGEPWASFPHAQEADVNAAVDAAQKAFEHPAWCNLHATARGKLLRKLGDLIATKQTQLAQLETNDNGKLIRETKGQIGYMPEFFYYYAGQADKLEGQTLPLDKTDMFAYTTHEPLGVVAAIIPWNSPMYLTAVKLAPALAAGNTVVLKPSEHASATILELMHLVQEAGFPDGVVNVVTGLGVDTGSALTKHPLVRRIAFTGGGEGAKSVIKNSAENLAQVSLELGGKSPNIIFEDADIGSAVNGVIAGIFAASGQSCVAGSRLLVQDTVYDEFLTALKTRAASIIIGDPLDPTSEMGPMATQTQLTLVERMVATAIAQGAELIHGGKRAAVAGDGWYFEPTILAVDDNQCSIMQEEVFGPVASIMRFKDEAEALALANDTEFGLAAGIWTRDNARVHRMSKAVQAGIIWVNTYRAVSPMGAIGGYKASGYGRESGIDGVKDYTQLKTVWINTSSEPMADPFVMR